MNKIEIDNKLEEIMDKISPNGMSGDEKEEILSELDSLLSFDPQNTDILETKALVYQFTEDYEDAINIYNEILKLKPNDKNIEECIKDCKDFMSWNVKKRDLNSKYDSNNFANNTTNLLEKISIWHIRIFKVIVIAAIIYLFFMH